MALAQRAQATERIDARLSPEEKELLEEAANIKGLTLTAFIKSSTREVALKTLKEQHVIELGRKDQQAFAEAMLNPDAPSERLRGLAKRPGFRYQR